MATEDTTNSANLSSATLTLVTNGLSAFSSLAFGITAARWFGAEGRGQVVAFMYWPSLLTLAAMLGVPTAATYYAAHRKKEAGAIVGTGMLSVFATSCVTAAAVAILTPMLVGSGSPDLITAARLYSVSIVLVGTLNVAYHPLRVLGHFKAWNLVRLLADATPLIALVGLVLLSSKGLITYATLLVGFQFALLLLGTTILLRYVKLSSARDWVKPLFKYGIPTVLATLPALLNFRVDQAFLVRMVDRAELGNYATAVGWSQVILIVINVVNYMVLPRVAALTGNARTQEYDHLLRFTVLVVTIVAVPVTLVSPFVVPLLFGEEFSEAGRLSLVLVPAAGLLGLNSIAQEILRADHRLRGPLVSQVLGLAITIGAVLVLVPLIGVWGAAFASVVAYLCVSLMLGWYLAKEGQSRCAPFLLPRRRQFNALRNMPGQLLETVRSKTR
ncbi:MAG: oligosaccharide flippase family protein [Microthrixaceae bacterium]